MRNWFDDDDLTEHMERIECDCSCNPICPECGGTGEIECGNPFDEEPIE